MSDANEKVREWMNKRAEKGPRRLWAVSVQREITMCVVASSIAEAERIAEENAEEEADNVYDADWCASGAHPLEQAGDFAGSIPWGVDDGEEMRDATVEKWLTEAAK